MQIKKNGVIRKKYRKKICNSFVKQFVELLQVQFSYSSEQTITDTSNNNIQFNNDPPPYWINPPFLRWDETMNNIYRVSLAAVSTDINYGSVVGSGLTTVDINDYKLETQITHGVGAGQLQYSEVVFGAPTTISSGTSFVVTRIFTNNSGNDVTINEIGLIVGIQPQYSGTFYYVLIARDNIVSSPPVLVNGESLTLNYTLTTTI